MRLEGKTAAFDGIRESDDDNFNTMELGSILQFWLAMTPETLKEWASTRALDPWRCDR